MGATAVPSRAKTTLSRPLSQPVARCPRPLPSKRCAATPSRSSWPARHQHYLLSFKGSAGKTAAGSQSGFEDGAADPISKELHRALEQLYGWLSPVSTPFAAAAVPLLPDVSLLFAAASGAPPELLAPVASHRALLAGSSVAADAAALWLTGRYVATPLRPVPDAP